MPTKLVVWNIQRFGLNKIHDSTEAGWGERFASIARSLGNLYHILRTASTADILSVIEVQSSRSVIGSLIGASGASGCLLLLAWLRKNYNASWCLVPPLKLVGLNDAGERANYTEGIAVFYRSDRLSFTGPYVWPTDGPVAVPPGPGVTPGPYPDPWAEALPAGNTFAGQAQFFSDIARTHELLFVSGNNRRPFLTTFTEIGGAARAIKLLSVHPSPNSDRISAVSRMSSIREIANTGVPQVVVLAGDFNINLFSTRVSETQAYVPFIWDGFCQQFTKTTSGNGRTRVSEIAEATTNSYSLPQALDNVFTRYDGGLVAPANNPQIIDRVAGVPGYPSDMLFSLAQLAQYYPDNDARQTQFRSGLNYGHIGPTRGTSDHLALVIDL